MTTIIGLDVGRGYAVAAALSCFPVNIKQYFKQHRSEFISLPTTIAGMDKLLAMSPDALVIEPSGYWYCQFWVRIARVNKIPIYWVGHSNLAHQRGHYGFVNKRDEEDALCLAATYFDSQFITEQGTKRYLNYGAYPEITRLRELFLEKEQLAKLRSGTIAQLKQRLSYEFPEVVKTRLEISPVRGYTPLIGWLTGAKNTRYEKKWRESVAHKLGITISNYTREHAKAILELELRISDRYFLIGEQLDNLQFKTYHRVFDRFGFGINLRALLLVHLFPFERFLIDSKPWIEWEESRGKMQKRDRSLRKFQAFMGLSYSYKQSGDVIKRKFHGSSMIRSHLYAWAICQITPRKSGYKVDTEVGRKLSDRYQDLRVAKKVKGKDAVTRILFVATRLLYYELLREIR